MTRLYENKGLWRRTVLLSAFLILVMIYGVWELYWAARGPGEAASMGALFGVLFLGGGVYSFYQLFVDYRDLVVSLDRDASGALVATVWQPTGPVALSAGLGNWRPYVKVAGRNMRTYFILADHPGNPRPLRFDVRRGIDLAGLRQVAPEAIAEYEAASGQKPA